MNSGRSTPFRIRMCRICRALPYGAHAVVGSKHATWQLRDVQCIDESTEAKVLAHVEEVAPNMSYEFRKQNPKVAYCRYYACLENTYMRLLHETIFFYRRHVPLFPAHWSMHSV